MQKKFYSNGKLLLSGEYVILDGAKGLAVPTKFGQSLSVKSIAKNKITWKSLDADGTEWFSAELQLPDLTVAKSSDSEISKTLQRILIETNKLNPNFLNHVLGCKIESQLTFPRNWGLGTSSTLINNIANWAEVDAHELLWNSFGGSGYDISCAQESKPLFYQIKNKRPQVETLDFNPKFKEAIYFVYLNQKQSSKKAISNYKTKRFDKDQLINQINNISEQMVKAASIEVFQNLMARHEMLLSKVLDISPVKENLFPDYSGSIKSLGAWGGDFIMAVGNEKTPEYFKSKGFKTVLSFKEMVL